MYSLSAADAQVVNAEDLEGILGPRPFRSAEMRNIDKFRDGFTKRLEDPSVPPTPAGSSTGVVDVPPAGEAPDGISVEKPGGPAVDQQTAESTGRTVAS